MKMIVQFSTALALLVFCSCRDNNTTGPKESGEQPSTQKPDWDWCGTPSDEPVEKIFYISTVKDVKGIVQRFDKEKERYLLKYPYYLLDSRKEKIPKNYNGIPNYMKLIPLDNRFTEDMVGKEFTFTGELYLLHTKKYEEKDRVSSKLASFYFFSVTE